MMKSLLLGVLMMGAAAVAAQAGESTTYPGYLTINMMGADLTANKPDTVVVEDLGAGKANFSLPNFALDLGDGPVPLGTIAVPDCSYTVADGITTYTGHVADMSLAGGEIHAEVTLNGTINSYQEADMHITVVWNGIPINVTFTTYKSNETVYHGLLTINMMGADIASNQPAAVIVEDLGEGKANFSLPNFALDLGDGPVNLGTISVPDCTYTEADGVKTYAGHVADLSLAGGEIHAEVTLAGTINAQGAVDMNITVLWNGIPINVTFKADAAGITDIAADDNAPVVYYDLQGRRVGQPAQGTLVIRRQGDKATKILF